MWETRSWRFPRKREIPRSWFLGDFPLPSFPPLAWIYETLLAGFDHPAGYFDSPTNSATEPRFIRRTRRSSQARSGQIIKTPAELRRVCSISRQRANHLCFRTGVGVRRVGIGIEVIHDVSLR